MKIREHGFSEGPYNTAVFLTEFVFIGLSEHPWGN
jgi:hypothetical protein